MIQAQQKALRRMAEAAVESEKATGLPAELTVAQCIVESAWLRRAPGNNCFGIKDTDRYLGAQYVLTREFVNGMWRSGELAFELYPTLADCFSDHALLLTRPGSAYSPAWQEYQRTRDLDALIGGIARHYATDPAYAEKILVLAHGQQLRAL